MTAEYTCRVCGEPARWIAAAHDDAMNPAPEPDATWQFACNSPDHLDLAGIDFDRDLHGQLDDLAEILCRYPHVGMGDLAQYLADRAVILIRARTRP